MITNYTSSVPVTTLANGSTLVGASGGLQFDLTWDSSVSSAPAGFKQAAITAASYFSTMYTNNMIVNLNIGYGEVNGSAIPSGVLSESIKSGTYTSYSSLLTALQKDAGNSGVQAQAFAALPTTDPYPAKTSFFGPMPSYYLTDANAKALGMIPSGGSEVDGYIGLSSKVPMSYTEPVASGTYDAIGCFVCEIGAEMGRIDSLGCLYGTGFHTPLDLFDYASNGVRNTSKSNAGYFSIDNGATNLGNYTTADPGLWASLIRGDAFGYGAAGVTDTVSAADLAELAVVGYNPSATGIAALQSLTS